MDEQTAVEQLAEFKAALAQLADPDAQQEQPTEPATLVEALHPGALRGFSAEDNQRFADQHLNITAEDMHGEVGK